ncbi:mucolipin-3 isoform X2 [Osmerus mordax]|uniref:mucolipin-3 isoform X2 n=1 Tax=Osmerus mordax TaxID=8014 RepID=UPI00350E96DA
MLTDNSESQRQLHKLLCEAVVKDSQVQMEEVEPLVAIGPGVQCPEGHTECNTAKQSPDCQVMEDFRRRLKYFFMNPCEKYRARGRKPWKLTLQILKIAIITAQLVSFGLSNEMMVTFKEENLKAFKHLFLKGYKDQRLDKYSVYTKADVYDHIYHIVDRYTHLQNLIPGSQAYEKNDGVNTPLSLCQDFYKNGSISPGNETFNLDPCIETECITIYPMWTFQNDMNFSLDFQRLVSIKVYLTLKAINLQTVSHHELPDCYNFRIMIMFDNSAHSGKIKIHFENNVEINACKNWTVAGTSGKDHHHVLLLDTLVILSCLISLLLCTRSVINGIQLQFEYTHFFQTFYRKTVSWSDRMQFVNGWYIMIIISDTLSIIGSALKIAIQTKDLIIYDVCSIVLGIATMLTWIGVIRYLGFYKKYNILILTLRASFPNVIRFSCCAAIIYLGYCFCGWIVLGPYHEKFRTFDKVIECLFSLMNGDGIYSTFEMMRAKSSIVWLFSRLYIYTFVSLFIYMVLSLFIALIQDTYETIKDKKPESQLNTFMIKCRDHPDSGRYKTDMEPPSCFLCSCLG